MRTTTLLLSGLVASTATAYPGMGSGLLKALGEHVHGEKRGFFGFPQGGNFNFGFPQGGHSTQLIGDLQNLPQGWLSQVGQDVRDILQGKKPATVGQGPQPPPQGGNPSPPKAPSPPASSGSSQCAQDTCCVWTHVAQAMTPVFTGSGNLGCTALARGAIRLGFHDAAAWNNSMSFGGADGSILLSADELPRSVNDGLDPIANQTMAWYNQFHSQGVGMADLIQFGAIVATVACPLGPRIKFLVGRKDSTQAPPDGLLPMIDQSAEDLLTMFAAKTLSPADLVALVGAHTVSQQFFQNTTMAGAPQDTTDGVWDTLFYSQTSSSSTPHGVFKFPSDVALSQASATKSTWQAFAGNGGQGAWGGAYSSAYFRMSLFGVSNINSMTDCTSAVPS